MSTNSFYDILIHIYTAYAEFIYYAYNVLHSTRQKNRKTDRDVIQLSAKKKLKANRDKRDVLKCVIPIALTLISLPPGPDL